MAGFLTCSLKFGSLNKTKSENIFCKICGWKEQSMKWERGLERELQQLFRITIRESLYLRAVIPRGDRETAWDLLYFTVQHLDLELQPCNKELIPHTICIPGNYIKENILGTDSQLLSIPLWEGSRACNSSTWVYRWTEKPRRMSTASVRPLHIKNGFLFHPVTHVLHVYIHNVLEHPPVWYGYITATPLITLVTLIISPSCSIPILTSKRLLLCWRGRVVSFCNYQIYITINTFIPYIKIFSTSV